MATITTIAAGDQITNSRTDINTNFANLNSDKIETSVIDTDTAMAANSDAKIPSQKAVKAYVDAGGSYAVTAVGVMPYIYPIGAIFMAIVSTNPNTLLGFGTWAAWAQGRVPIGVGTGSIVATFASRASNVITVTGLSNNSNNEFQTGQAVLYTAASGAMTGLTHNTTYYLIRVTNTTFSLATTLTNAQNGTVIALSSDGTGTQTFTLTLTARAADETGGEENHAMSATEELAHVHDLNVFSGTGNNGVAGVFGSGLSAASTGGSTFTSLTTNLGGADSTGGNAAMNNMQPFVTCYMWKRTA